MGEVTAYEQIVWDIIQVAEGEVKEDDKKEDDKEDTDEMLTKPTTEYIYIISSSDAFQLNSDRCRKTEQYI